MSKRKPDPREILGRRVKELRAQKGITQEELADRCEMFRTYLSRIESGLANPTLTALNMLAAGLEVSVLELLSPPTSDAGSISLRVRSTQPLSRGRVNNK